MHWSIIYFKKFKCEMKYLKNLFKRLANEMSMSLSIYFFFQHIMYESVNLSLCFFFLLMFLVSPNTERKK